MPTPTERIPPLLLSRDAPLLRTRHHRDPRVTRVRRGVYADADAWHALKPWERYRGRVNAAAMIWPDAIFCLESAAVMLGLPVFGEPRFIHLLDPGGKSRRYGDILVHSSLDELDLVVRGAMTLTSLADTALELCRVLPPAFALATADAMQRLLLPTGTAVDISALGRERANRRGRRQLDWVQARATAVSESVGESVSRAVIEWLGFDEPELQTWFAYEGVEDRTDFYWRRQRVIGESDGYGKYDASDAESAKATFIAEKVREDRLRRHEDGFARWDWGDTMRAERLGAKLGRAGLTPSRSRQDGLVATLRSNPRSLSERKARPARSDPPPGADR